jgi:hypothetical protein
MFASPFKDDPHQNLGNAFNNPYEKKHMVPRLPSSNSILNMFTKEELSKELRRTYEAIWVSSSSMTTSCTMRGTTVETFHDPSSKACIISEIRMETLVGRKPLITSDKLFLSNPYGYFECRGITKDVPMLSVLTHDKNLHTLPYFSYSCGHLIIGTPCYLRYWRMWYS